MATQIKNHTHAHMTCDLKPHLNPYLCGTLYAGQMPV